MSKKYEREYTDDDLALFEQCRPRREAHRPQGCSGGERCWVALGPPGFVAGSNHGHCLECTGQPR